MDSQLLTDIIRLLILILGTIITMYVIPWIKSKFDESQLQNLNTFISWAVRSAEQMFTPEQWAEKKQYVVRIAREWISDNMKITFTDDQLNSIIEGIVNAVKKDKK